MNFFKAIPKDQWTVYQFHNSNFTQACALGHCYYTTIEEGIAKVSNKPPIIENAVKQLRLGYLFMKYLKLPVFFVNDNSGRLHPYQQKTPKQRILAALADIKQKIEQALPKTEIKLNISEETEETEDEVEQPVKL